jgi:tetratricopeptide (TPR) repeat protein
MRIRAAQVRRFIPRISSAIALIFLVVQAWPALWAQDKEWDKHMKAGGKEYSIGMLKKYYWHGPSSQTSVAGAPEFAKAEREFLDALALTKSFPTGDVGTAQTLGMLANTYSEERKFAEAEERGKQAMAILEGSLTPNNPELGSASISMALIYDAESKPEQAAPLWDRGLAILTKTGKVSPQWLSQLQLRALSSDMDVQAQIYGFIVALEESTGAPDKDLRSALRDLARTQKAAAAEQIHIHILEIDKTANGPDSPMANGDLNALGTLYANEGRFAAALPLLQRSLEFSEKAAQSRAPCNPRAFWKSQNSRITCMGQDAELPRLYRELAEVYTALGKYPDAEEIYKQLISEDEAKAHDNRKLTERDLTNDLRSLARVYSDEHRYDEAVDAMKRCTALAEAIEESKPATSPGAVRLTSIYVWLAQGDLAEIYREKGDNAAAEPVFQKTLDMSEQMHLAHGHPKLAQLLDNYATLLRDEGRFTDAEPLYKHSLEIWAKARYPDHPDVAETLTNYAALLRKMNRPTEAEPLEARALALRAQAGASGWDH